jgi:hypothetical protein
MIDPTGRLHNFVAAEAIVSGGNRSEPPKSQSFAAELSDELAGTVRSAPPTPGTPPNLPVSQQIASWRLPGSAGDSTSGLNGLVITYPDTTSTTAAETKGSSRQSVSDPMSFDDAYWANQPPAVQQLRDMQSQAQRATMGAQLAQEGYTIDVPIMVWGWDPATTTAARQSMGYTWVPSAGQQPVEVAPGLTFAGAAYDPAHPPPGSIIV